MVDYCVYIDCSSRNKCQNDGSQKILFKSPKDIKLLSKWISILPRYGVIKKPFSKEFFVCKKHHDHIRNDPNVRNDLRSQVLISQPIRLDSIQMWTNQKIINWLENRPYKISKLLKILSYDNKYPRNIRFVYQELVELFDNNEDILAEIFNSKV